MNRRNWKPFVIAGAAIMIIAVVVTILLIQEQSLSGKIVHIPPDLVVERCSRSLKASRGEDLEIEEPILCG